MTRPILIGLARVSWPWCLQPRSTPCWMATSRVIRRHTPWTSLSTADPSARWSTEALAMSRSCADPGWDLGCGAVTARLNVSQDQVSWSEFLWEGGVGDPTSIDVGHEVNGRFVFN